jgi:hypothetical protein
MPINAGHKSVPEIVTVADLPVRHLTAQRLAIWVFSLDDRIAEIFQTIFTMLIAVLFVSSTRVW